MAIPRSPPTSPYDALETELVGARVLLTRARGHMSRSLVEQRFDQFTSLLSGLSKPCWIVEQLELTGFHPCAVTAGARWFSAFKNRGGEQVVFVSQLAAARMTVSSLAFAVHAKLSWAETLREAYERTGLGAVEVRPSMFSLPPPSRR